MAVFNIPNFRTAFPAFSSEASFPDVLITSQSVIGECYINAESERDCASTMWQLITAHLLTINQQTADGNAPIGQVTSANVGGVSVSVKPPESKSEFGYWLGLTQYGIQLQALLKKASSGGVYVGGARERAAFRRVGGGFSSSGILR